MPIFEYKAITSSGKSRKGIVDADTPRDARSKLRGDHMHVTEMWEVVDKKKNKNKNKNKKGKSTEKSVRKRRKTGQKPGGILSMEIELFQPKISTRDLATFTRQFSTLLRSGIQLADALNELERVLRNVKEEITSGNNLAEAMAKHPRFFSDLYVNMVKAGEASGRLDLVLVRIADYLQKQASLKGKVLAAITYPAIMVVVGMAVVIFLMSYVVPKITAILEERGGELPFITEVMKGISDFTAAYWIYMMVVAIIGGLVLKGMIGTDAGRLKFDTILLRLPLFGNLFSKQAISRFALTFSTLLKSGLPALDSLKIVALVVNNAKLTQVINDIHARIIEGADIATPIKKSKVFPPMVGYMISVGEQSGQLEEILDRIAESYEEELDLSIQRLTSLIEPIIIILLAVVVGFIIAAVLLPLLDFSSMG